MLEELRAAHKELAKCKSPRNKAILEKRIADINARIDEKHATVGYTPTPKKETPAAQKDFTVNSTFNKSPRFWR